MHLTGVDAAVLAAYFVALSLIGIWCSRGQRTRGDYHLAGRRVHWLLAGGSVMVTLMSTLTFLAAPGEMIRYGIAFFAGALALPLVAPAINRILIPLLRSLPVTSIYEYLEIRYSPGIRTLAAVVFVFRTTIWIGLIVYSCTLATVEVTGLNFYGTLLVTGLVTTFYASIGGLKSVVWTDNIQLLILLGGALVVPLYVAAAIGSGPVGWWSVFSQAGRAHVEVFSLDPSVRITVVGMIAMHFFWTFCVNASDQAAAQRYLATPTAADARRSVWVFAMMNFALTTLLMVCGLALFAFYQARSGLPAAEFGLGAASQADQLMPRFIARELPPGVSGLLLAALLAAAMSSISSGVNSISSVAVTDLLRPREGASLRVDKVVAAAAGLVGIGVAVLMAWSAQHAQWNLYELTSRVNNLFAGPMAVFFLSGILLPRAGPLTALVAFGVAMAAAVTVSFGAFLFGVQVSFTWLVPLSFLAGMATAAALSLGSSMRRTA